MCSFQDGFTTILKKKSKKDFESSKQDLNSQLRLWCCLEEYESVWQENSSTQIQVDKFARAMEYVLMKNGKIFRNICG